VKIRDEVTLCILLVSKQENLVKAQGFIEEKKLYFLKHSFYQHKS